MMNKNIKLSIILPVTRIDKSVKKCIDSLFEQDLQDWELLLINNSLNNNLNFCKEYSMKDSRIRVFEQQYSELGKAKNIGIENARGEYISFLYSEDFIDKDFYLKLIEACEKYDADVSCGSIIRTRKGIKTYKLKYANEEVYTNPQKKIDVAHVPDMSYVWNKVYKTEFLKRINLKFIEGMFFEDVDFVTKSVYFSNKIVIVPDPKFHYLSNCDFSFKEIKSSDKKRADSLKSKEMLIEFFKEHKLKTNIKNLIKRKTCVTILGLPIITVCEWDDRKKYYLFNCIQILEVMTST